MTDYRLAASPVGSCHYDLFPEIGGARWEVHRRALAGDTIRLRNEVFHRADGTVQWLNWEVRPWGGDTVRGILMSSEEIPAEGRSEPVERAGEPDWTGPGATLHACGATPLFRPSPAVNAPPPECEAAMASADCRAGAGAIVARLRGRNGLLSRLSPSAFESLAPHLALVMIPAGKVLIEAGAPLQRVYFPLEGAYSRILRFEDGGAVEVGLGGRDDAVGVAALAGGDREESDTVALLGGSALTIGVQPLRRILSSGSRICTEFHWHLSLVIGELSRSAACHARHTVNQRLARWLLTAGARSGLRRLEVTQERIAESLGATRPSVSEGLAILIDAKAIVAGRGWVMIHDPARLESLACECFREGEDARARLAPPRTVSLAPTLAEVHDLLERQFEPAGRPHARVA
jgi:CRP-like cAMP-binding protein